jgi:RIO kinase 1
VYEHDYDQPEQLPMRRSRRTKNSVGPSRRGRLTEREKARLARVREEAYSDPVAPDGADRWSTWDRVDQGPVPRPDWVVTELAAVDHELGVLKTGKEADVHLLRRGLPDGPQVLLAAKRYRSSDRRDFHRDAAYLEGRRMRRSREMRAIEHRTSFGRNLIAEQWAVAEFGALSALWSLGAPVPYPVQRDGTELLMEFIGSPDGAAAPRLAQLRPDPDELHELWLQLVALLDLTASAGLAHGDLSAYNLLVHDGQLVLIDLPQIVDVVANPNGEYFLQRDVRNVAEWFHRRGLPESITDVDGLIADLLTVARG